MNFADRLVWIMENWMFYGIRIVAGFTLLIPIIPLGVRQKNSQKKIRFGY